MIEALQYEFMRNALIAGVLVSIAMGIIGAYVVTNRMVFISGGIAHAAYGGVGLGYYLGLSPVLGAFGFSVVAAMIMGHVQRRAHERSDTMIGVLWALGMALGIVLIDLTPGYKADLMSYLFGSILAVPQGDLIVMALLDVVILFAVALLYRPLLSVSFDAEFATVRNVPTALLQQLLLALIAFSAVMIMRVVGLILVIALLTVPAAIAGRFVRDMKKMMALAAVLAAAFAWTGIWLSYLLDLTSGATIVLVCGAAYFASLGISRARRRPANACGHERG